MANVAQAAEAKPETGPIGPVVTSTPHQSLNHPALERLLQRAYSAERAASFAYIGHAGSLRDPAAKAAVKQIEDDLDAAYGVEESHRYCARHGKSERLPQ